MGNAAVTWTSNNRVAHFLRSKWSPTRTGSFMAIGELFALQVRYAEGAMKASDTFCNRFHANLPFWKTRL